MEQTLAKFVPTLLTVDALRRLDIPSNKLAEDLPKMIQSGLDRLYSYQHEDGGWGWYSSDPTDRMMTAHVVAGLYEAKRLGAPVDSVRLERGQKRLRELAKSEKDLNRLAFMGCALSRGEACGEIDRLVASKDKLTPYALAATALALHRWNRSEGSDVIELLLRSAKNDQWKTGEWLNKWENMDVETTSLAILALVEEKPEHPLIPRAVDWLLSKRRGNRWRSTKDTAAAVHAILSHLTASGGRLDRLASAVDRGPSTGKKPELLQSIRVKFNGEERELLVDLNDPTSSRFECSFECTNLRPGSHPIDVRSDLELDVEFESALRTIGGPSTAAGISVTTQYDRRLQHLRIGDEILASVTVRGDANVDYVLVEAPIPAGCEVVRGSGEGPFAHFEARYEKAVFFLRSLTREPTVLTYRMRCAFAGQYTTPPPTAAVMYDESIGGSGTPRPAIIRN